MRHINLTDLEIVEESVVNSGASPNSGFICGFGCGGGICGFSCGEAS